MLMRALTILTTKPELGVRTRRHLDQDRAVVYCLCEGFS
jgi:hypothetical protein